MIFLVSRTLNPNSSGWKFRLISDKVYDIIFEILIGRNLVTKVKEALDKFPTNYFNVCILF